MWGRRRREDREGRSTVVAVLVRLTVIALVLGAYYLAVPALFPDSTDANIGAGLVAFAGTMRRPG